MTFKCYRQPLKRKMFVKDATRVEAIFFLQEFPNFGIVEKDGKRYTIEELQDYVESFRQEPRVEFDSSVSDGGEVSEDSGPELFDTSWGYTE